MVERVVDALVGSRIDRVHAAVSPATPATAARLRPRRVRLVETPGDGYVADLGVALSGLDTPVLTVVADLPLLSAEAVEAVLERWTGGSTTVCVPVELKRRLGVSVDTTLPGTELAPSGCNVVDGDTTTTMTTTDRELAVNVNRPRDAAVAEAWL
jgi:adenosylcobinamide-phosphate guanylyltransferase